MMPMPSCPIYMAKQPFSGFSEEPFLSKMDVYLGK